MVTVNVDVRKSLGRKICFDLSRFQVSDPCRVPVPVEASDVEPGAFDVAQDAATARSQPVIVVVEITLDVRNA